MYSPIWQLRKPNVPVQHLVWERKHHWRHYNKTMTSLFQQWNNVMMLFCGFQTTFPRKTEIGIFLSLTSCLLALSNTSSHRIFDLNMTFFTCCFHVNLCNSSNALKISIIKLPNMKPQCISFQFKHLSNTFMSCLSASYQIMFMFYGWHQHAWTMQQCMNIYTGWMSLRESDPELPWLCKTVSVALRQDTCRTCTDRCRQSEVDIAFARLTEVCWKFHVTDWAHTELVRSPSLDLHEFHSETLLCHSLSLNVILKHFCFLCTDCITAAVVRLLDFVLLYYIYTTLHYQ